MSVSLDGSFCAADKCCHPTKLRHLPSMDIELGMVYSARVPLVVTLPILLVPFSVNHRFPSRPLVIPCGLLLALVMLYSLSVHEVVTLPLLLAPFSVSQRLPSCPAVMARGSPELARAKYSVKGPDVVVVPILSP